MADLLLVRHGETEWSRSGRHTSRTDLPLTERGAAQARALRPLLAAQPLARVLVSPRERARQTARIAGLADRAETEPDLREWDYGGYEGRTTPEIQRTRPTWSLWTDGVPAGDDPDHPGESPEAVAARADRLLARLAPLLDAGPAAGGGAPDPAAGSAVAAGGGEPAGAVLLVAHAHILRAVAARRLGLPVAAGALFRLDTATLSRIGLAHDRPTVLAWNVPAAGPAPQQP
ncbi:histidine phosphatase family protein [Streptomyces sp. 796.1]|uniref:histidine phosphatase family protein n=1 Tax=Streptomyces sp. 796.1 TaxID=3163029 RepID=UPI0039C96FA3